MMTLDDLRLYFKPQIGSGVRRLFFMKIDNGQAQILSHPAGEIETLLPILNGITHQATPIDIPRFIK